MVPELPEPDDDDMELCLPGGVVPFPVYHMSRRQYVPDLPCVQLMMPELPEPDDDDLELCLPGEWFLFLFNI